MKDRKLSRIVTFSVLITLLMVTVSFTADISGYTYKLSGVLTSGGNNTKSSSYVSTLSIAQPAIGQMSSSNYKLCLGVYCTETFNPPYEITTSGKLFYDNGSTVSNADIRITINYKSYNFESTNKTDGAGNFFVKISNLPEFMRYRNFDVKIYVVDEIEALYECTYNTTTQQCS